MPQLDQRLVRLAEQRPPVGAGVLIQRIESRVADSPVRRVSPALHPIRAMTMAGLAVLVFVGGVAVGHWAFGSVGLFEAAFGGADVWTTTEDISVLAMVGAGAGGGVVLLAGSLGLAWRWRRRRQIYRSSTDQGGMMETIEKATPTFDSTERVLRINRWMAVALILALAALVALGAWLLIDNFVSSDVEALVKEHEAAFLDNDFAAWSATVTDDYTEFDSNAGMTFSLAQMEARMSNFHSMGFAVENLGPMSVNGDWVSVPQWVTFTNVFDFDCFSLYEIEEGLIKQHLALCSPAP